MREASLWNGNRQLVPRVEMAVRWWQRMRGLLGRASLDPQRAMFLEPANSVHTWFMEFSLDLIFLDREGRVVRLLHDVAPWRMAFGGRRAYGVVELATGWLPEDAVSEGDMLRFSSSE